VKLRQRPGQLLLTGTDTRFYRPSHLIGAPEHVERLSRSLPGEPEGFRWGGLFAMDLHAQHSKWGIAGFSRMELMPCLNLDLTQVGSVVHSP
jgi:hypothetical protein